MLHQLYAFLRFNGVVLLLLMCLSYTSNAQEESLTGKWLSCSMTYRGKVTELKARKDKTIIVFENDNTYETQHYTYNNDSNPMKLCFNFHSGYVTNADGKILRKRREKEVGNYQVNGSEVTFKTTNYKYLAQYQFRGKFLFLTHFVDDSLRTGPFVIKFKRLK